MKGLKKAYEALTKLETWFMFLLFFVTTLAVVINVILRKLFSMSFPWIDELSRFIMLVTGCVGLSVAMTGDLHPKMDSLASVFRGRAKQIFRLVGNIVTLVIMAIVAWYSVKQGIKTIHNGAMLGTVQMKLWVFWIFVPLGFVGATVRTALNVVFDTMGLFGKDPRTAPEKDELEELLAERKEAAE